MCVLVTVISAFVLLGVAPAHAQEAEAYWELVPELRIGHVDRADYALTEVDQLAIGHDGEMYIGQQMEGIIRVYNRAGDFIREIGGRGEGPGEFVTLGDFGWRADSLWVIDWPQQRVAFFDRSGEHLATQRVVGPLLRHSSRPATANAVLKDGTLLAIPTVRSRHIADGTIKLLPILRLDRSGVLLDTLGMLNPRGAKGSVWVGDKRATFGLFIKSNTLWKPTIDGSSIVVVHRPIADSGDRGHFQIDKILISGDTAFSRRYRYSPKPVPSGSADAAIAQLASNLQLIGFTPIQAGRLASDSMRVPHYQAPVSSLVTGRDGSIWLRREGLRGDEVNWVVLDARGEIVMNVRAPSDLEILQASREQVWGVVKDDLDVPYVIRYRVSRFDSR